MDTQKLISIAFSRLDKANDRHELNCAVLLKPGKSEKKTREKTRNWLISNARIKMLSYAIEKFQDSTYTGGWR